MVARRQSKTINWPMAQFMLALATALILGFVAYGYFNGNTASRLDRLESDMRALQAELHQFERRREE